MEAGMRTNIVIDDTLMHDARQISGFHTKRETIESALKLMIKVKSQSFIKKYRGKLKWQGDLESMRKD
jgi:Arc/MetJ family transcription regulator